jgi:FkbM family methyltransferase
MAKSILKKISGRGFAGLNWLFGKLGYRLDRFDQLNFFEPLLYRRLAKSPEFFFVQIGANDGIMCDPIREFVTRNQIAGLAVEPLKDMFAKLEANYRDFPKVKPVNVALHATEKTFALHRVDPAKIAQVGIWSQGTASFKKSHHAATQIPDDLLIAETVKCLTLSELLEQYQVPRLDLLQIDTEGYDFQIIKMIDFARWKPAILRFEHGLPDGTMSRAEFDQCAQLLLDHGYYLITEPYDVIAYQPTMI